MLRSRHTHIELPNGSNAKLMRTRPIRPFRTGGGGGAPAIPPPDTLPNANAALAERWDAEVSPMTSAGAGTVSQIDNLVGTLPIVSRFGVDIAVEKATNGRFGFAMDNRFTNGDTTYGGCLFVDTALNRTRNIFMCVTMMPTFPDPWPTDVGPVILGDTTDNRSVFWQQSTGQMKNGSHIWIDDTYYAGFAPVVPIAALKGMQKFALRQPTYAVDAAGNLTGTSTVKQTEMYAWVHEILIYENSGTNINQGDVDAVFDYFTERWHS